LQEKNVETEIRSFRQELFVGSSLRASKTCKKERKKSVQEVTNPFLKAADGGKGRYSLTWEGNHKGTTRKPSVYQSTWFVSEWWLTPSMEVQEPTIALGGLQEERDGNM